MKLDKISFEEIFKFNKKIILFGSGSAVTHKTINILGKDKIEFIYDNAKNLNESKFEEIDVKYPFDISKEKLIVICSTAIGPISKQLDSYGLVAGEDYVVSPFLNDRLAIYQLENIKSEFYFTSGSMPDENSDYGGGFYKLSINREEKKVERIYSGSCYGTFPNDNQIFFVDCDNGVMSYDRLTKKISKKFSTPIASRAHGISINKTNGNFYITCSNLDSTIEYDYNFNEIKRFEISKKIDFENKAVHHANDNYAVGNSLYVSMFSRTGNYRNEVFDGCILEFDIKTGEKVGVLTSNLYMPHNISIINGSFHVLDSLPGHLKNDNFKIRGTFPAFTRGLSYNEKLYYIGQSKNRNYSKVQGISNNISIDCGVIIFDVDTKISRFIQLPMDIGEIHSIVH